MRSYWRNYFEKTDALIWVVDATDRLRIQDCREELHGLLQEERLSGATLLVFANKTDVKGCMDESEIQEVSVNFGATGKGDVQSWLGEGMVLETSFCRTEQRGIEYGGVESLLTHLRHFNSTLSRRTNGISSVAQR